MKPANRRYADLPGDLLPRTAKGLPLTLIGYWDGEDEPGWPRAADFVDEHWDEAERDLVASYLEEGLIPWGYAGPSECRFCGAFKGTWEWTDGVYLWPQGLAHYLREHDVRPPVSVIRHVVASKASIQPEPSEDEEWWKTLHDHENCADEHHVMRPEWWTARVNEDWWKTATLDS